jgi:hypothetical protein
VNCTTSQWTRIRSKKETMETNIPIHVINKILLLNTSSLTLVKILGLVAGLNFTEPNRDVVICMLEDKYRNDKYSFFDAVTGEYFGDITVEQIKKMQRNGMIRCHFPDQGLLDAFAKEDGVVED